VVNDCFKNESNAVVGVFLKRLFIKNHWTMGKLDFCHLGARAAKINSIDCGFSTKQRSTNSINKALYE
jgi:hypothetical protein